MKCCHFVRARRSGVDRFLGMEEASGSIPDVSTVDFFFKFLLVGRRLAYRQILYLSNNRKRKWVTINTLSQTSPENINPGLL